MLIHFYPVCSFSNDPRGRQLRLDDLFPPLDCIWIGEDLSFQSILEKLYIYRELEPLSLLWLLSEYLSKKSYKFEAHSVLDNAISTIISSINFRYSHKNCIKVICLDVEHDGEKPIR